MAKIKQCDECKTETDVTVWKMQFPWKNILPEDLDVLIFGDNAERYKKCEEKQ